MLYTCRKKDCTFSLSGNEYLGCIYICVLRTELGPSWFRYSNVYFEYCKNAEYRERSHLANSVYPDQTAPREQSDQGLHCLPSNQCILTILPKVIK